MKHAIPELGLTFVDFRVSPCITKYVQYLPLFSLPFILTEQIVIKCIKIYSKLRHLLRVKSRALMF